MYRRFFKFCPQRILFFTVISIVLRSCRTGTGTDTSCTSSSCFCARCTRQPSNHGRPNNGGSQGRSEEACCARQQLCDVPFAHSAVPGHLSSRQRTVARGTLCRGIHPVPRSRLPASSLSLPNGQGQERPRMSRSTECAHEQHAIFVRAVFVRVGRLQSRGNDTDARTASRVQTNQRSFPECDG